MQQRPCEGHANVERDELGVCTFTLSEHASPGGVAENGARATLRSASRGERLLVFQM